MMKFYTISDKSRTFRRSGIIAFSLCHREKKENFHLQQWTKFFFLRSWFNCVQFEAVAFL
ncbi:hypothetical protein T07_7909 [Trichinella nelsoni]|uniref:Uncharacterized protein n=1 Tax=Trichinella nelsoni TaxID=6336 RepID=A0A0V0RMK1_9BILA|nr:hypothetical protein T07_7909 [Trichinella nelsoni]